ncbi:hypothetical protein ABMA27_005679 [Loxostege sticticalis]|uniref:Peptidase S1 domain-containing protein n=1 Tax=Loxostege sticticalis TaxID=481309 RepID=A0ABR3HJY6_LOXSC
MWFWSLFSLLAVSSIQLIEAGGCDVAKPDFAAPGRRISEQKCHEFNWERKHLEKCSLDAANAKYPYMGAIGYRKKNDNSWTFLCGSFLISKKFVVTAAQCAKVRDPDISPPEIVRFGNDNIKDEVPRLDVKILKTITHPEYKPPLKYYDIGLMELESEVPFSRSTYPACLWSQAALEGVEYAGNPAWGTDAPHGKLRTVIAEMTVKVVDQNTCLDTLKSQDRYTRHFRELQEHHICANESESYILNCQGSAGAPLITTLSLDGNSEDKMPYAFGVTSFGWRCGYLSIYTRVSSFIDWIEQTVWPESKI